MDTDEISHTQHPSPSSVRSTRIFLATVIWFLTFILVVAICYLFFSPKHSPSTEQLRALSPTPLPTAPIPSPTQVSQDCQPSLDPNYTWSDPVAGDYSFVDYTDADNDTNQSYIDISLPGFSRQAPITTDSTDEFDAFYQNQYQTNGWKIVTDASGPDPVVIRFFRNGNKWLEAKYDGTHKTVSLTYNHWCQ